MVRRVRASGFPVTAHVRTLDGREALKEAGVQLTTCLRDAVTDVDIVFVTLFNEAQVRDAILGPDGALAAMRPGAILVSHVTTSPTLATEIERVAPDGVQTIDAAFSGSRDDAANGHILILAGGEPAIIDRAKPVMETYAHLIAHMGPVGAGQRAKLINNLLFSAQLSLVIEAVRAADQSGMNRRALFETLQQCSGASFPMRYFTEECDVESLIEGKKRYLDKDTDAARALTAVETIDLSRMLQTSMFGTTR
jgi:3-hydroxyisobutyrate dehydrogenase-like beta-hydroxyacid dehydrogenase